MFPVSFLKCFLEVVTLDRRRVSFNTILLMHRKHKSLHYNASDEIKAATEHLSLSAVPE